MVDANTLTQIRSWSPSDRLELIEEIWVSLDDECFVPPVSEELKAEVARRRDAVKAHPERSRPWEEVVARV